MDSMSNPDEKNYHPSTSSMDQTEFSPMSRDSFSYCRTNSGMSAYSEPAFDSRSCSGEPSPSYWPGMRSKSHNHGALTRLGMKHQKHVDDDDEKLDDEETIDLELEIMKEKFSKLLLGEDMSGTGKGVCTAVTLSNAITNLYATIFGHNLKLEPLHPEKKAIWKREMECLLSVCDYIVDFVPAKQVLQDGTAMEVMITIQRSDIYINLPALKKLDTVLIDILDSFQHNEFWYNERGSMSGNSARAMSFRRVTPTQQTEEKWWLPVPCMPLTGLSEDSRKHLIHKRDSANQIHKAAMAINSSILSEMEIPETYILNLPKNGKAKLGDSVYRYMSTAEKFSPDYLLDSLKISSEREALEFADRIESSMYTWRRKACLHHSKTSWSMVKEFTSESEQNDKNTILAVRAEGLLFSLKQRYPALSQTTLDASKIQYNKDVGKAVLESYSRVLEGLAFNIVAWIDEVLYADISVRSQS